MRRRELFAALVMLLVGAPMVFMMARALADGVTRHREAVLATVLGPDTLQKLRGGEQTPYHYLGNDLLAPDFTLPDRHGKPWKLSDHRGKVLVLNFWSITCPPCIEEMPSLEELAHLARDWGDVEVVAISTDEGWEQASTVLSEDTPLTVLFDPDKEVVGGKFGSRLYPETWIIDARGVVRFRYDGPRDWSSPLALDLVSTFR